MMERGVRTGCLEPEELAAYIDERLNDADAARVEQHLAACDDCRSLLIQVDEDEEVFDLMHGHETQPERQGRWFVRLVMSLLLLGLLYLMFS
jgi:predicted anti-sigma-YlaC factor YlaD